MAIMLIVKALRAAIPRLWRVGGRDVRAIVFALQG